MLGPDLNEKGIALISVLFVVVILTVVAAAVLDSTSVDTTISMNNERELKALYLAESGLQKAMEQLWEDSADTTSIHSTSSFAGGSYSVRIGDTSSNYYKLVRSTGTCGGISKEVEALVLVPRNPSGTPTDPRLLLPLSSPGSVNLGGESRVLSGDVFAGTSLDVKPKASANGDVYITGTFTGNPDNVNGNIYRLTEEVCFDSIDVDSYRSGFPYFCAERINAFEDTVYNPKNPLNIYSLFYVDSPGRTFKKVVINGTLIVEEAAGTLDIKDGIRIEPLGSLPAIVSEVPISISLPDKRKFKVGDTTYVSCIYGIVYSDSNIRIECDFSDPIVRGVVMAMGDVVLARKTSIAYSSSPFLDPPKGFYRLDSPHYRTVSLGWREIF